MSENVKPSPPSTTLYYFRVRSTRKSKRRTLRVVADSGPHALSKALALYPVKYVKLKKQYNFKTMDLITAKVEAAALSVKKGKRTYINLNTEEEECEVSTTPAPLKENVLAVFAGGNEVKDIAEALTVAETPEQEAPPTKAQPKKEKAVKVKTTKQNKTVKQEKVMSTKTKAKKPAPKKAAKKSTPVKKSAAASKPTGKGKLMTIKSIIALVSKGNKAFNKDMKPLPLAYLKKFIDPAKEILATITAPE